MTNGELIAKVRKLRDEVTAEAFGGFTGQDRCASMVITKLDEAEGWLIRRGLDKASHLLIDKAHYAAQLQATQPDTTDTTGDS